MGSNVTGAEEPLGHCRLEKADTKRFTESIEGSSRKGKPVAGMKVWRESMSHKGRLIEEKNCMYAAQHRSSGNVIYKTTEPYN